MAQNNFEPCHAVTAKWEGGWSDHAADPGGKTNFGVTQATLGTYLGRAATADEIRALTKDQAKAIFKKLFWHGVGAEGMPRGVDLACYDWGVNSGVARGRRAYSEAAHISNPAERVKAIMAARRAFFAAIIAKNGKLAAFRKGWANRAADIEAVAYKWALQAQGLAPAEVQGRMAEEAGRARKAAEAKKKQANAAGGGAAAAGAGSAAVAWDWQTIIFCGVAVGVIGFVAFMAFRAAQAERARTEAFLKGAGNG